MGAPCLHLAGRDLPYTIDQVDFAPLCVAKFARSYEDVRSNLERELGDWITGVVIDRAE